MSQINKQYSEDESSDVVNQYMDTNTLLLHNDDHHTFDFVVETLIDVCLHEPLQAEQCTFITHYKGKCDVKKGNISKIKPLRDRLAEKGLKATIE